MKVPKNAGQPNEADAKLAELAKKINDEARQVAKKVTRAGNTNPPDFTGN